MSEKLLAIWRFTVAVLAYPLAFAALIWIGWTGRSILWAMLVLIILLAVDRTWLFILRRLFQWRPADK